MRRTLAVAALVAFTFVSVAVGQETVGPAAGTWAAEAGAGGSLLRFRSPASAWILGGTVTHTQTDIETSGGLPAIDPDPVTRATLRLGIRRYRNEGQPLRPFYTIAPIVTFFHSGSSEWGLGGMLEAGAAHFFSRHVSLGASGALTGTLQFASSSGGGTEIKARTLIIEASVVRVLAAVYF
jgi:hypothetical protein